jgi:hypothetical protein
MRDVELFVRYLAFQYDLDNYTGNLKKFLDDECKKLNQRWTAEEANIKDKAGEMEEGIRCSYEIFQDDTFRKWEGSGYENRFNRAVFDVMTYYFADRSVRSRAASAKARVKSAFQTVSQNPAFVRSLETTTKSVDATGTRFRLWGEQLSKTLGIKINLPDLGR